MRAVIQRVLEAKVEVGGEIVGQIGKGLLVYLGVGKGDGQKDQFQIFFIEDHERVVILGIPCPAVSCGDVKANAIADGLEFFEVESVHCMRPAYR